MRLQCYRMIPAWSDRSFSAHVPPSNSFSACSRHLEKCHQPQGFKSPESGHWKSGDCLKSNETLKYNSNNTMWVVFICLLVSELSKHSQFQSFSLQPAGLEIYLYFLNGNSDSHVISWLLELGLYEKNHKMHDRSLRVGNTVGAIHLYWCQLKWTQTPNECDSSFITPLSGLYHCCALVFPFVKCGVVGTINSLMVVPAWLEMAVFSVFFLCVFQSRWHHKAPQERTNRRKVSRGQTKAASQEQEFSIWKWET